jgi:hypothetical protein
MLRNKKNFHENYTFKGHFYVKRSRLKPKIDWSGGRNNQETKVSNLNSNIQIV